MNWASWSWRHAGSEHETGPQTTHSSHGRSVMRLLKQLAGVCLGAGLVLVLLGASGLAATAGAVPVYDTPLHGSQEGTAFADAEPGSG